MSGEILKNTVSGEEKNILPHQEYMHCLGLGGELVDLTVKDVAKLVDMKPATIRRLAKRGVLQGRISGGNIRLGYRFSLEDVNRWISGWTPIRRDELDKRVDAQHVKEIEKKALANQQQESSVVGARPILEDPDMKILTTEDVAKYFQISVETVRSWTRTGRLQGIRLGGSTGMRYTALQVNKFLNDNSTILTHLKHSDSRSQD